MTGVKLCEKCYKSDGRAAVFTIKPLGGCDICGKEYNAWTVL